MMQRFRSVLTLITDTKLKEKIMKTLKIMLLPIALSAVGFLVEIEPAEAAIKTCYVKPIKGVSGGHRTQRGDRAGAWLSWQTNARSTHNQRMPYRSAITVNGYPATKKSNRRWNATVWAYPCYPSGAVIGGANQHPCQYSATRAEAISKGCSTWIAGF